MKPSEVHIPLFDDTEKLVLEEDLESRKLWMLLESPGCIYREDDNEYPTLISHLNLRESVVETTTVRRRLLTWRPSSWSKSTFSRPVQLISYLGCRLARLTGLCLPWRHQVGNFWQLRTHMHSTSWYSTSWLPRESCWLGPTREEGEALRSKEGDNALNSPNRFKERLELFVDAVQFRFKLS